MKLAKQSEDVKITDKETESFSKLIKTFEVVATLEFATEKDLELPIWPTKVANFIVYCVDGGLLCAQFTLTKMIQWMEQIQDSADELAIKQEIIYLLHCRKRGQKYERKEDETIT